MLTGILVLVLLLVALLAIPVELTFAVAWPSATAQDVRLGWAFGLVSVQLASSRDESIEKKKEAAAKKPRRRKTRKRKKRNVLATVRHKAFRRRVVRFAGDIWRAVHAEDLRLRIRTGLGDPADTGQLWAVLGPVSGMLETVEQATIRLEPDFIDATLEFDGSGHVRAMPLQLMGLALALLFSPPVWQGVRQLRAA